MPWLTPNNIPEDDECRPLFIPHSAEWLAIVSGAILELTRSWNWEEFGELTPEECAERMLIMQQQFYEGNCLDCTLPSGGRIIRIGFSGHFEEMINGEWGAPQGDYAVPAVPARTGGTPEEQRCLAAANAENVLAELYEEVTDMFNNHISQAEALFALGVSIGLAIAPPLGLLAGSVLAISLIAFGEFFAFMDFLTEDVWDNNFSEALRCFLYECSLNDAGVVTFDVDCVWEKMKNEGNPFDLSFSAQRLLGQVGFLLSIIGIEGLNLAGATTAITSADCDDCDDAWCFVFDFEEVSGSAFFSPLTRNGCVASWSAGVGWTATLGGGCAPVAGNDVISSVCATFDATFIRKIVVVGTSNGRNEARTCAAIAANACNFAGGFSITEGLFPNGTLVGVERVINNTITQVVAEFQNDANAIQAQGTAIVKSIAIYGNGECPFGEPNCLG